MDKILSAIVYCKLLVPNRILVLIRCVVLFAKEAMVQLSMPRVRK